MSDSKELNYRLKFAGVDQLSPELAKIRKALGHSQKELKALRKTEKQYAELREVLDKSRKVRKEFKLAQERASKLGKELANTENPTKKMSAAFRKAQADIRKLRDAKRKSLETLHDVRREMKAAGLQTNNWGQAQRELARKIDQTNTKINGQRRELREVTQQYERAKEARKQYQDSLQNAANLGIAGASGIAVGQESIRFAGGFLQSIRPVEKAIGQMRSLGFENIDALKAQAQKTDSLLAYTTEASFIEATYNVKSAMSNLSEQGVAELTHNALVAARATRALPDQMTSLMGTAHGIYKNTYKDISDSEWSGLFSSGLAASVKAAKTTGAQMQRALENAGAGAAILGSDMAEEFAILASLQKTLPGSEAGTARKEFVNKVAHAQVAFKKSGRKINLLDSDGMLKDTKTIMTSFRKEFGAKLNADEMKEISKAFGTDEASKFVRGLYVGFDEFQTTLSEIKSAMAEGKAFTQRMAKAMDNNVDAQIQQVIEEFQTVRREIGDALVPVFTAVLPTVKALIRGLRSFIKENKTLFAILGSVLFVFGLLASAFGGLTLALAGILGPLAVLKLSMSVLGIQKLGILALTKSLTLSLYGFAKGAVIAAISAVKALSVALMATPVGGFIAAMAAIAGTVYLVIKFWKPIKTFFSSLWAGITTTAVSTWRGLKSLFSWSPIRTFSGAWSGVTDYFSGIFKHITQIAGAAMSYLNNVISAPFKMLSKLRKMLGLGAKNNTIIPTEFTHLSPAKSIANSPLYAPTNAISHGDTFIQLQTPNGMDERQLASFIGQEVQKIERQRSRNIRRSLTDIEVY